MKWADGKLVKQEMDDQVKNRLLYFFPSRIKYCMSFNFLRF